MFALIKTNGATEIVVHIPREGAEKSLPALVGMLEKNTVFLKRSWRTLEQCEPKITIELGNKVTEESPDTGELAILVPESDEVLDESFVTATPEVLISNKKIVEGKDAEIGRLRKELDFVKQQLEDAKAALEVNEVDALAGVALL